MNMRSMKLLSIAAVLMMFMVPFSVIAVSSDDTDASSEDYTNYYSKQLEKLPKAIYDAAVTMTPSEMTKEITLESTWFKDGTSSKEVTEKQINDAIDAAMTAMKNDNDLDFSAWMNFNAAVSYQVSPNYTSPTKLSITIEKYNFAGEWTADSVKTDITQKISEMNIDPSSDRYTKVTAIHDWVVSTMIYPTADHMNDEFVRSVWNAFCGDSTVVCEGYAKAFKAACDYYGIPCIIVSGNAQGQNGSEGHMWNYVKMDDDRWYLVDTTWDDQATINHTYLLAGTETNGFNMKVGQSYDATPLKNLGFVIPELSAVAYNDPSQKYHVSLCYDKDSTAFYEEDVLINSKIAIPENPHRENYIFNYWANAADDSVWDFNTPVKKDTVLYAKWTYTDKDVFDVVYNTNGADTVMQAIQVEDGGKITLPNQELTRSGYKFIGWNTNANGDGVHFEPGSEVTVSADITLYADWEATEDQSPYKIDSTVESAGEFLSGELIPGISNSVLVIAIITGIVVVLAIVIIARKS